MTFKSNLKRLLVDKGFNNKSLSLKAGLNETAVRDILQRRKNDPRLDVLEKLATALDVAPSVLAGYSLAITLDESFLCLTLPDGRLAHYHPTAIGDTTFEGINILAQIGKLSPALYELSSIGRQDVLYPVDYNGDRGIPIAYNKENAWNTGSIYQKDAHHNCKLIGIVRWISIPFNKQLALNVI